MPGPISGERYQVKAGDTLYGVSRRSGIPLRALIDSNELQPPYSLQSGQVLTLPRMRTHEVAPGDTLYSLSKRYEVSTAKLAGQNDISPPYRLIVGEVLTLPPKEVKVLAASVLRDESAQDKVVQVSTPRVPPKATEKAAVKAAPTASSKKAVSQAQTQTQQAQQGSEAVKEPLRPKPTQASLSTKPRVLPDPPARAGGRFFWPVRGKVLEAFGPQGDGLHNDGINIAAPRGTSIRAAENAVVAYVGSELRGYGNLLLLRHDGGYISAYAHAETLLVEKGDIVKRGQAIAKVGKTGSVTTPQLHFEIRKGKQAIDPLSLLAQ